MKVKRSALIHRKTKETEIKLSINLDGSGQSKVNTSLPFLDHMLDLFSKHSGGPSHVLPTGGSARFSSGLSVKDFYKWSSVIERKEKNASSILNAAVTLAEAENLENHALSLKES